MPPVYHSRSDRFEKLKTLGEESRYDVCLSSCSGGRTPDPVDPVHRWIYPAALPGGGIVPILKVLLSNACKNNCFYCPNRSANDRLRTSFKPEELASSFMALYRARRVHGLFLSSGIYDQPDRVMEDMVQTADILRRKYQYKNYLHLKILPGASPAAVERACLIASRVSLNLEAPNPERLAKIAPGKDFSEDLLKRMQWASFLIRNGAKARSQTTQFIVGASGESDQEILSTTDRLYRSLHLHRTYFSAFQPLPRTPLESHPPGSLIREHRLYQADWLLRFYHFRLDELSFLPEGNLSLELDPKTAWARKHPETFPIDINRAEYEELIRIPGIGIRSAERIIQARRARAFSDPADLNKLRVSLKRAAPYILINGKTVKPRQTTIDDYLGKALC